MIGHPVRCTSQELRTMDGDNRRGRDISKGDVRGKVPWAKVKGSSKKGCGTYKTGIQIEELPKEHSAALRFFRNNLPSVSITIWRRRR